MVRLISVTKAKSGRAAIACSCTRVSRRRCTSREGLQSWWIVRDLLCLHLPHLAVHAARIAADDDGAGELWIVGQITQRGER